ncbi:MAG: DUF2974 domain-containing protein, partial [Planctomycetota bacterium]|nr:DUF2974 domain-containing protein [Planctomycetota bacterium]
HVADVAFNTATTTVAVSVTCECNDDNDDDDADYGIENVYTLVHMAKAAYQGANGTPAGLNAITLSLPQVLQDADWKAAKTYAESTTGFHAVEFENTESGEIVIAFAGTQMLSYQDWINNLQQGLGFSANQYNQAVALAKIRKADLGANANKLAFAGHSLGGGLASAAALATGLNAMTFNAAGIHKNTAATHGLNLAQANNLITAYRVYWVGGVVPADILTFLQAGTAPPGVEVLPNWLQLFTGNTGQSISQQRDSLTGDSG